MTSQISERIIIAKNFKSFNNWAGKTLEKKEKMLKRAASVDYWLIMVLLSFLILISAMSTFNIDCNWANAGALVFMTMVFSIRAPYSYIELMLHKHISQIKNNENKFDQKLNIELDSIVKRFNNRKKHIYLIWIPLLLISISAFLQLLNVNPYWSKFPPLVLVVSLYLFIRINYDVLIIKKNLAKVINAI